MCTARRPATSPPSSGLEVPRSAPTEKHELVEEASLALRTNRDRSVAIVLYAVPVALPWMTGAPPGLGAQTYRGSPAADGIQLKRRSAASRRGRQRSAGAGARGPRAERKASRLPRAGRRAMQAIFCVEQVWGVRAYPRDLILNTLEQLAAKLPAARCSHE
jgi:hypothetical protein